MADQKIVKLDQLKLDLQTLRIDNKMGRLKNFNSIKEKKKQIARLYTEINKSDIKQVEEVKKGG